MKNALIIAAALFLALSLPLVSSAAETGSYLVQTSDASALSAVGKVVWADQNVGWAQVVPYASNPGTNPRTARQELRGQRGVRTVVANDKIKLAALPAIPAVVAHSPAPNEALVERLRVILDANRLALIPGVVIDSGVNRSHPAIKDCLLEGESRSFVGTDPLTDPPATDIPGHGTYVSATICSIAPNARIISFQIFWREDVIENGVTKRIMVTDMATILKAFAALPALSSRYPRMVVNSSFMFPRESELAVTVEQIMQTLERRAAFASASGNHEPGQYANVMPCVSRTPNSICAGSVNGLGFLSSFSNYGSPVTNAAIGENVRFLDENGIPLLMSGTSFSSPKNAGAIALMWGMNLQATPQQLIAAILAGGDLQPLLEGKIASSKSLDIPGAIARFRQIMSGQTPIVPQVWDIRSALDRGTREEDKVMTFSWREVVDIWGTGFCDHTEADINGDIPTRRCGVEVRLNNQLALPIISLTQERIRVMLPPDEFRVWPENHWGLVLYDADGVVTAGINLRYFRAGPHPLIAANPDGTPVVMTSHGAADRDNPVRIGETIRIYVSGLGLESWESTAEKVELVQPLQVAAARMPVDARVQRSEYMGLYQVDISLEKAQLLLRQELPLTLSVGEASVSVTLPYSDQNSQSVLAAKP
ncbi:MAG: S8 family serine peptidase [Candidatus Kerfeldbacteria bacterium]|nr:S8 family serine peptidase [Candidatus Kerfeldbacteria bacterium]